MIPAKRSVSSGRLGSAASCQLVYHIRPNISALDNGTSNQPLRDQLDGPGTKSEIELGQYRLVYQPRELSVLIGDFKKKEGHQTPIKTLNATVKTDSYFGSFLAARVKASDRPRLRILKPP